MILTKFGFPEDSRLDEDYLGYKVDEYRAIDIRETFKKYPVIDPIWIQDYGIFDTTVVNSADEKSFTVCKCKFSKVTFPSVVSIINPLSNTNDLGVYSIRSACGTKEYNYLPLPQLMLLTDDNDRSLFKYFYRIGNSYYLTPEVKQGRSMLILENPLNGFVNNTEYQTVLVVGTQYEVAEGQIVHAGFGYQKGQIFTAVNTIFTGSGKIWLKNQKRAMTNDDQYPMSQTQMERVILSILTKEFGIEQKTISDVRNNSQDEAKRAIPNS
jgi:hypothetical protein